MEHPIDFVIPWVDGGDPEWIRLKNAYLPAAVPGTDAEDNRFRDWDTLRYWFRAVEKFAPWVNRVHFVTCGQFPEWLNPDHPKLHFVRHEDYIPASYLPTFSSHPIELNMHRIEGLSEHFVYFNDDFFLLRPVEPTLFFRDGLPCDNAILSPIILEKGTDIGLICANNMRLINRHFDKDEVIGAARGKWLSPRYGKELIRNLCLMPWHHLPGFYNNHLPQPYLKSTFEAVWAAEPDDLNTVSCHRFRDYHADVSQWLMRYWQLCENRFVPVSPKRGICFTDMCDEAAEVIRGQRYPMVCINDSHEQEFERHKAQLHAAFDSILPDKCSFEK